MEALKETWLESCLEKEMMMMAINSCNLKWKLCKLHLHAEKVSGVDYTDVEEIGGVKYTWIMETSCVHGGMTSDIGSSKESDSGKKGVPGKCCGFYLVCDSFRKNGQSICCSSLPHVCDFFLRLEIVGPPKKCSRKNQRPMGGVIPGKKIQTHDPHEEKPTKGGPFEALSASKSSSIVGSGGIPCADVECNLSNGEKNDLSIQQNLNFDRKSLPSSIPTWRGKFQILQTAAPSKFYDGFEAQPPFVVNAKAYKFSTEMPSVLQLESRPALNVLTDIFLDDSPNLQDIALYFFPSQQTERSRENLISILTFMNAEKSMLRSYINGVELLIFTPYQLDMNSRGVITAVNAGHFLWGFFRKKKIDKRVVRVPDKEPDMGIDMVGGRDMMERADHVRLVTPKLVSDNDLDVPPGFEKLPKFHK
ncbi:unnamed protein product [Sphenostylis stenocarpa]|uniref:AIPP2-like SPOC-like domain-containing protein n=1 Tax=Sphenostylis stenocarpa TaxID=92480 RepID=A0AA86TJ84_9FABA|nr:unnamed protein product [Sphenostylis stenocarpa]